MKKHLFDILISILICFLLLSNISFLTIGEEQTTSKTIYVDEDNSKGPWLGTRQHPFQSIHHALADARDGDIIRVFEGTYNESEFYNYELTVNKHVSIIGNGSHCTTIGRGVKISCDHVLIKGFTVYGAWIVDTGGNIGLYALASSINLINSNHCIIKENKLQKGLTGISLSFSSGNSIINNTIMNPTKWNDDETKNFEKTVIQKENKNQSFFDIPRTYNKGILLKESDKNNILENTIKNADKGILIYRSKNNKIFYNNVYNNDKGIIFENSSSNNITKNMILENNNSVELNHSHHNSINNNFILHSESNAVWVFFSYYNDFHNNYIFENKRGFELGGYKNRVYKNIIKNNSEYGIHFWATCANEIYENNLIDNNVAASFSHVHLIEYSNLKNLLWINNNQLYQNFWNKPKDLPKLISGSIRFYLKNPAFHLFTISWVEFDWNPAQEPNQIEIQNI